MKKQKKSLKAASPQKFTRPPIERMLKIHAMLNNKDYPTCRQLALKFEVSERTIQRDIDYMLVRLGLPISYRNDPLNGKFGYFYTQDDVQFPAIAVTETEMFTVCIAQQALEQYRGTPFYQPLEIGFNKMLKHLDPEVAYEVENVERIFSFRPFGPGECDARVFQAVTQGLRQNRVYHFCYEKMEATGIELRRVWPNHLSFIDNHWYLFANDLDRNLEIRTFVLSRMSEPLLKDETFKRPPFNVEEYLRGSFGAHRGTGDYHIDMALDRWGKQLIKGRRWHHSQVLEVHEDGTARMTLHLTSLEEVARWILGLENHVTVHGPPELRERLYCVGKMLVEEYGPK